MGADFVPRVEYGKRGDNDPACDEYRERGTVGVRPPLETQVNPPLAVPNRQAETFNRGVAPLNDNRRPRR